MMVKIRAAIGAVLIALAQYVLGDEILIFVTAQKLMRKCEEENCNG